MLQLYMKRREILYSHLSLLYYKITQIYRRTNWLPMRKGLVDLSTTATRMWISIGLGGRQQTYAQRIAEPVHLWLLSRPEDLAIISLLLLKHRVLDVDFFPDFGRGEFARDVSGNDVVVGRGGGVFIKRCNSTSQHDNLDYGRGSKAYN